MNDRIPKSLFMLERRATVLACLLISISFQAVRAEKNDWAEGTTGQADGASRDYYNRAGLLAWKHFMGDWRDVTDAVQGARPYATATVTDDDQPRFIEWPVTNLVRDWLQGTHPNQGVFLRATQGGGCHFRSREHRDERQRPELIVTAGGQTVRLLPQADTYLDASTYRSMGDRSELRVAAQSNNALLRFDLSDFDASTTVDSAVLRLFTFAQYGTAEIAIFRCAQGHLLSNNEPQFGLAANYASDRELAADADVIFVADFESPAPTRNWTFATDPIDVVDRDDALQFEPWQGKAARVKIAQGANAAMNVGYKFQPQTGNEPDQIYVRYYLRLADDWNQTLQGGKLPGISGTYGIAGWGGRKSDGRNGWSARGSFHLSIPEKNPLAGLHPIGTYCYHADMPGNYGEIWLWQNDYLGYLQNNRWYAIEQYLKLNTVGKKDGILRAWVDGRLAFEKTDIRFRHVDRLKIEQVWMNVYHGGTKPSPYDQHLFIDSVVIAKKYIGPVKPIQRH